VKSGGVRSRKGVERCVRVWGGCGVSVVREGCGSECERGV
jgi:hypothetical protein